MKFFTAISLLIAFGANAQKSYFVEPTEDSASISSAAQIECFTANLNNDKIDISWSTNSEKNNDFYVVERSQNGVDFQEVIRTQGSLLSSVELNYFEIDPSPLKGVSYYRIKQVDINGNSSYSGLVPVDIKEDHTPGMSIFPKTVNSEQDPNLELKDLVNQEILVIVRDIKGFEHYGKVKVVKAQEEIQVVNTDADLKSGTYLVIASSRDELYSQQLVVK